MTSSRESFRAIELGRASPLTEHLALTVSRFTETQAIGSRVSCLYVRSCPLATIDTLRGCAAARCRPSACSTALHRESSAEPSEIGRNWSAPRRSCPSRRCPRRSCSRFPSAANRCRFRAKQPCRAPRRRSEQKPWFIALLRFRLSASSSRLTRIRPASVRAWKVTWSKVGSARLMSAAFSTCQKKPGSPVRRATFV